MQNQIRLRWQQIPSPIISEILCQGHHDGVVLDMEHGFPNPESLVSCIQVIKLSGKKCLVRLSTSTTDKIRICLDNGADGIIFSCVESVVRAERLIKKCNYPHLGGNRGLGLVRQNMWGMQKLIQDPPILIAQIESKKGIQEIESLSKCCFDFFLIGPYDLSASLGSAGEFNTPEFMSALDKFADCVPEKRRAVHIPKNVHNEIKKYNSYGMIAVGMDTVSLVEKNEEYENA